MKFSEILKNASLLLEGKGLVSYRMLQRKFELDAQTLEDQKIEFVEVDELATDREGKMLLWRTTVPQLHHHHLAEHIRAEEAALESRGTADGERKTITPLFADLNGSTALIEGLDPEDTRAMIDSTLQLRMDAVHPYGGYVARSLGDGIFARFGAPIAPEDHPQRTLYAALRMREELRGYSDRSRLKGVSRSKCGSGSIPAGGRPLDS